MIKRQTIKEIPELDDYSGLSNRVALPGELRDDVVICTTNSSPLHNLPRFFHSPLYLLHFVTRGSMIVKINNQPLQLDALSGMFIFTDYVLEILESTDDLETYIIGFTPNFGEEMNLQMPNQQLATLYAHPIWHMSTKRMQMVEQYLNLLRDILKEDEEHSLSYNTRRAVTLNMVRSMIYFVSEDFDEDMLSRPSLSRTEDITGHFLALVEAHCREHHNLEWYASEMCLTSKYMANVVSHTIGKPAGQCIYEALMRQAKSLLLTTTLSIQEISLRLGFQTQSHFGTFFHRATGMSPSEFRRKN